MGSVEGVGARDTARTARHPQERQLDTQVPIREPVHFIPFYSTENQLHDFFLGVNTCFSCSVLRCPARMSVCLV